MRILANDLRMYFSYGQFLVFDISEDLPGCNWQEAHVQQGFARRESSVNFSTVLEFGDAYLSVYVGAYGPSDAYERVVAVPFEVKSGEVEIAGPEEADAERKVNLSAGHYRLHAAQRVLRDDEDAMVFEEAIDLFFEPLYAPASKSEILVADAGLNPPAVLTEVADIAKP